MRRDFWTDFGFPATTVLLAGALVYHFTIGHRAGPTSALSVPVVLSPLEPPAPESRPADGDTSGALDSSPAFVARPTWPPPPDFAALRELSLPRRTPLRLSYESVGYFPVRYDATVVLDQGGVAVELGPGTRIMTVDGDPPLRLDSLVFAVAEADSTGWRIVAQSPAWTDPAPPQPGAPYALPRTLRIDGLSAVDLAGRWPLMLMVLDAPPSEDEGSIWETHYRFIHHGDRSVFDDLFAGTAREER